MSPFNISCQLFEDPSVTPLNCLDYTIGTPTITEHTILMPYNSGLMKGGVSFRLVYSYRLCSAYEQVNFTGKYGQHLMGRWDIKGPCPGQKEKHAYKCPFHFECFMRVLLVCYLECRPTPLFEPNVRCTTHGRSFARPRYLNLCM